MNCRIKFGLAWPATVGRPVEIFPYNSLSVYNSLSAAIHLYMIRPLEKIKVRNFQVGKLSNLNGGKFQNRTLCGVATTPPQRPRKAAERFLAFVDPFSKGAPHSVSHSCSVHNMPILVLQTKNEKSSRK